MGISDRSSDVCSSDLNFSPEGGVATVNSYKVGGNVISWQDRYDIPENAMTGPPLQSVANFLVSPGAAFEGGEVLGDQGDLQVQRSLLKSRIDRKSTRLNSSH